MALLPTNFVNGSIFYAGITTGSGNAHTGSIGPNTIAQNVNDLDTNNRVFTYNQVTQTNVGSAASGTTIFTGSGILQSISFATYGNAGYNVGEMKFYLRLDATWLISGLAAQPDAGGAAGQNGTLNFGVHKHYSGGWVAVAKNTDIATQSYASFITYYPD